MRKHSKNLIGLIGTGLLTGALASIAFAADNEIIDIVAGTGACITGIMNLGCFVCLYKTNMNYYNAAQREKTKYKERVDNEMEKIYPSSKN